MAARHDILDRPESLKNPLLGSVALHAALFAVAVLWAKLPLDEVLQWGDPTSLGGSAVTITPVSKIPMPQRAGVTNPLANPTESQVPAPPPAPQTREQAPPKEDPEAIPMKSRQPAKKPVAPRPTRRSRQAPAPQQNNQLSSSSGAALTTAMFGSTSGGGGVGVGQGNPLGGRFGYYVDILQRKVAEHWNTGEVDPRLQTAPPVIVTFEILRNGSVRDIRYLQRSGHPTLDYSAQRAILDASPFPPLPAGFERNDVKVEFWFQLQR